MKLDIHAGDKRNRLSIMEELDPIVKPYGKRRLVRCRCDCGAVVDVALAHFSSGQVKSCGCWLREKAKITAIKHFRKAEGTALFNELKKRYVESANKRGLEFTLTDSQLRSLVQQPCVFCGRDPHHVMERKGRYGKLVYTGVDRLDANSGYTPKNCVPCCKDCNYAKQKMSVSQFVHLIGLIYDRTKSMSTLNDYIEVAQQVGGKTPSSAPVVDRHEQVQVGMDWAKRQAERQEPEAKAIPSMGTTPLAN